MDETIKKAQQALDDEKTHLTLKNLLLDWQEADDEPSTWQSSLEAVFDSEKADLFSKVSRERLATLIQQKDLQKRGNVKEVKWLTSKDEDVCETCQEHHGEHYPIDKMHELHPAHEDCRCELEPVLDVDISSEALRDILS